MKRFLLAVSAGLLAAAVAAPSFAADMRMPTKAYRGDPVFVAPFSWSGFYVGINGGYGFGKSDWTAAVPGFFPPSAKLKGGLVGGTIGYNMQTGNFVFGLEGDIDASWIKGSDTTLSCPTPGCETRNRWLATGRGRIGVAWDRWLPFVTGGVAFGDIRMDPGGGTTQTTTKTGWTLGGGVEYAFMGPWSAKLEYLYVDLGKATCSAPTCAFPVDVSFKTSIIRAGVNYRF